jgi:hypothetical protein
MGDLIPVLHDEVVPGDIFQLGFDCLVRTQPQAAPLMHPVYMTVHYFFVPFRVLGDHDDISFDWETFITGGSAGTDSSSQPTWNVTTNTVKSLWDYFGFPLGVDAAGARPEIWMLAGYNLIWNEYYMDADIDSAVTIDTQEAVLKARWQKDYFTAARPWQERGTSPALSITGTADVDVKAEDITLSNESDATARTLQLRSSALNELVMSTGPSATNDARWENPALEVDFSNATTFSLATLRLNTSIQKFMELSARAGYRYFEWIRANFGTGLPNLDARLDRPEYLGGQKLWLVSSEIQQTSETSTTPQGTLVGKGVIVASESVTKKRFEEFGIVMAMFCVRPVPTYHEGINRQWMRSTRYDFYNPLFAALSEQAILESELYCSGTEAHHNTVFGYCGRYDEMRYKPDLAVAEMRPGQTYDMYNITRNLAARPSLNASFLECSPAENWCSDSAEPHLIVHFRNRIRAIRPLPMIAIPGGTL